jgi:two-component system invasion response regulator UvrY
MRVLLVDNHQLVRQVMARVLAAEPDLIVVGQGATGQEAIDLTRQLQPEVVLINVRLIGLSGVEATRVILAEFPEVCVIGMTLVDNQEEARAIREAGAAACISKSGPLKELVAAIRACPRRATAISTPR